MATNKIPITRLKVAQIDRKSLPLDVLSYCYDFPAFIDEDTRDEYIGGRHPYEVNVEVFCHGDIFQNLLDNELDKKEPDYDLKQLKELVKQFCSFDYIMII